MRRNIRFISRRLFGIPLYELIKNEIKSIDNNLEIAFIPKVLYELNFIKEAIQEDIAAGQTCSNLKNPEANWQKKCWHLPRFADNGEVSNVHQKEVAELAYRLNKVIIEKMPALNGCMNKQEIHAMTEKELVFFQNYYNSEKEKVFGGTVKSPAFNFSASAEQIKNSVNVIPMGISSEMHANIIRKVVDLESSPIAKKSVFLYRGADLEKDSPLIANGDDPFPLSYGSSCFAGVIHDAGATAYTYMRNKKNGFAYAIPFEMFYSSPFRVPEGDVIRQLHGHGEKFHGRSRLWGKGGYTSSEWNLWKSDLKKQQFLNLYNKFKSEAIHLK